MANIKIKTHVVKQLPTERPLEKGAVYKVEQPNGDLLTYTINSAGEPVLERGITDDQNTRLERLSSDQISKVESITTGDITKLKQDYTKAEIDQQLNDVRNLANSSRINLNGATVLPVPPRRPDNTVIEDAWVRLAQNVTYTQSGGSPLTGIDGHETVAEWDNEDGEWVLVDMGELPFTPTDGAIQLEDTDAVNGNTAAENSNMLKGSSERVTKEVFDLGIPTQVEVPISNGGIRKDGTANTPDATYRRTSVSAGANMVAWNGSDRVFYTGIMTINSNDYAGVIFKDSVGNVVGYDCTANGNYVDREVIPPVGTAFIGSCSYGADPIIKLSSIIPKVATKNELTESINNALTDSRSINYTGVLAYRYYQVQNDTVYETDSEDISQVNGSDSDTINIEGSSGNSNNTLYLWTGNEPIQASDKDTIVFEGTINANDGLVGLGLAYEANGNVRGILYLSDGRLVRTSPYNNNLIQDNVPTLSVGDVVRIEADIRSSSNQIFRFYKNNIQVYEGAIDVLINLSPGLNQRWRSVIKGYDVSVTIKKLYIKSYKFPTFQDVENIIHPTDPILQGFKVLPDRPTGAPSGGFTCTGLDRITRGEYAGCWIIGNDGRTLQGDSSPYTPEVLILDADFNRILKVISMPYSGASLQGVAVDTSGSVDTFWVATASNGTIRHFNLDGTEIIGDRFDWSTAYSSLGSPNGLAYDPINDAVWCCVSDSTGEARLISCNPAIPNRELRAIVLTGTPDQLHLKGTNIYYTIGSNGVNGSVRIYDLETDEISDKYLSLPRAQAIEGLYIDEVQGVMYIANDGGYHFGARPALNIAMQYRI